MAITYAERAELQPGRLQDLFTSAWAGAAKRDYDRVLARSFGWISAHDEERLVGFVNIAWDGGVHFFMLDTTVHPEYRRRGIGAALVRRAIDLCRRHGEWLHVDAEAGLMNRLYLPAGFTPTDAGVLSVLGRNGSGSSAR